MSSYSVGTVNPEKTPLRLLLIEDYEEDAALLQRHLSRADYVLDARRVETAAELHAALLEPAWDLVIADYTLPSFGARDALEIIQASGHDVPFIIVSGTIDDVSAVSAMRAGAHDYVLKGHLERLLPAIARELSDARRRKERLRTEAELALAQNRFSATFNQAAVGMAHTNTDSRFLLVNQRLADMLLSPMDQLIGFSLEDFVLPSEQHSYLEQLEACIQAGPTGKGFEIALIRTNGSTFPAQLTVSLLRHAGSDLPTVLWVIEDISARKAAERETGDLMTRLINSERLAAAGRMANTLAHEINNPLEALTNIFYLLQTQPDMPAQSQELLGVAAREIERVGHITRSTLSFYRKLPGRTIDLRSMLDEVVQLFHTRATQHQVKIEVLYGPGIEQVQYDPALRQVFANLIGNALEAMEHGGGCIRVRARLMGNFASVIVSDMGHGIERENLKAIFEPFFTTKGERGTGLGLWVTRGIVEEQGGRLSLRTRTKGSKRGTTIRVTLPAVREPASQLIQ
jgi:PAS domain S-box-containing protein